MSQQGRRFTSTRSKSNNCQQDPSNLGAASSPTVSPVTANTNSKSTVKPSSTLPQVPPNYRSQDLTIHIDPEGRKTFVNSIGIQSMVQPFRNKFFGDFNRKGDGKVEVHNRQTSIEQFKQEYQKRYNMMPDSKIYNYNIFDINLLAQYYQNLVEDKEKKKMSKEWNFLKLYQSFFRILVLGYSIFFIATRRMKWSRLTLNYAFPMNFYVIGGSLWLKAKINLQAFPLNNILQHNKLYENILITYQNDKKIVY